nr:helix-turn-helix domain-containing protein [Paenibacillus lautus]
MATLKVLIVDDEVIIRNGLSTVINWADNGFTVLTPAASAEEALQRIPVEMPEIIFTDIRMTGLSGLDMAHEVKQQYPEIEIIVISGYDEFSYAQKAMREGVSDYLLKTSRPGEIIEAAVQARERLLQRRLSQAKGRAQELVVSRGFLRRLLASGAPPDGHAEAELWERYPQLRLETNGSVLQIWMLSVHPLHQEEEERFALGELHSLIGTAMAEGLQGAWLEWNGSVLLLVRTEPNSGWGRVDSALRKMESAHDCRITAASGRPVSSVRELPVALSTAVEASSYEWLLHSERHIRYEDIEGRKGIRTVCSMEEETELSSLLRSGQSADLQAWVTDLLRRIQSQGQATPGSVQAYLHSLIISAQRWLIRAATSIGYATPVKVEETYDIRELTKTPEKVLVDSLELIMKQYRDMVSTTSPVQRAISFIHEHLGQSLSLQQVAKHVHMNPNYFSEMFKKETGQNYIEFVTQAKLRKAMHLLRETPAKISEIANEIGYEDIKYFNRLFKKWTGQTPSEYRANPEFCPSMD